MGTHESHWEEEIGQISKVDRGRILVGCGNGNRRDQVQGGWKERQLELGAGNL